MEIKKDFSILRLVYGEKPIPELIWLHREAAEKMLKEGIAAVFKRVLPKDIGPADGTGYAGGYKDGRHITINELRENLAALGVELDK